MALRAWSGRRIATLWLLAIGVYGTVAILGVRQRRAADAAFRERFGLPDAREDQPRTVTFTDAGRDSVLTLLLALYQEASLGTPAHQDSLRRQLTAVARDTTRARHRFDSIFQALNLPARLDSAQRDSLRNLSESLVGAVAAPVLEGVDRAFKAMVPWMLLWLAVFLAPAVALVVITIAWAVLRRGRSLPSDQGSA